MTSAAHKPAAKVPAGRASGANPVVVYVASSLDGTSLALDPASRERIREAFPGVRVSTRHLFIAHDAHEAFGQSIGRFEEQIAVLLTGLSAERLAERFSFVSFRDPKSEREVARLPEAKARALRRA